MTPQWEDSISFYFFCPSLGDSLLMNVLIPRWLLSVDDDDDDDKNCRSIYEMPFNSFPEFVSLVILVLSVPREFNCNSRTFPYRILFH